MTSSTRLATLAAALCIAVAPAARSQALATFGSVEFAGFGEGSVLIGTSFTSGRRGWGPVGTLVAQTYRFRSGIDQIRGNDSHEQAWALSPGVGLQYAMPRGSAQVTAGYTFVSDSFFNVLPGSLTGGRDGVFLATQFNYWGAGANTAQAIGTINLESQYYWTRARAAHRFVPAVHPVYLGAELVLQGSEEFNPSIFRYQFGPTVEYRVTPDFRLGASGGYRGGNNNAAGTGYVRLEFLALTAF